MNDKVQQPIATRIHFDFEQLIFVRSCLLFLYNRPMYIIYQEITIFFLQLQTNHTRIKPTFKKNQLQMPICQKLNISSCARGQPHQICHLITSCNSTNVSLAPWKQISLLPELGTDAQHHWAAEGYNSQNTGISYRRPRSVFFSIKSSSGKKSRAAHTNALKTHAQQHAIICIFTCTAFGVA